MKKVVVTGGLASGKTTVCRLLRELGAYIVSADEIVHELLELPRVQEQVEQILHLKKDVSQNTYRELVANLVFRDPQKLAKLEALLHPLVFHEIDKRYEEAKAQKTCPVFVAEIPLFYESAFPQTYDAVLCVTTDESIAKRRFCAQPGRSMADFETRNARQLPVEQKAKLATYTLANKGTLNQLKHAVSEVFSLLTSTTRGAR